MLAVPPPSSSDLTSLLKSGLVWQPVSDTRSTGNKIRPERSSIKFPDKFPTTKPPGLFKIDEIDSRLPPVDEFRGKVQEYFFQSALDVADKNIWFPPMGIITGMMGNYLSYTEQENPPSTSWIIWLGKKSWPTPQLLGSRKLGQHRHLFLDPPASSIIKTALALLQENACAVLIMAIEKISFTDTRKLQLAAKNSSCLFFVSRPPWEKELNSAAFCKWWIGSLAVPPDIAANNTAGGEYLDSIISWKLNLLKIKSTQEFIYHWPQIIVWKEDIYGNGSFHLASKRTERQEYSRNLKQGSL